MLHRLFDSPSNPKSMLLKLLHVARPLLTGPFTSVAGSLQDSFLANLHGQQIDRVCLACSPAKHAERTTA